MTGTRVHIDARRALAKLKKVHTAFDENDLLEAIGGRQLSWINQNFRAEGRLIGGWKPLAESTKRRRRGTSFKILRDTGKLEKSFDAYNVQLRPGYVEIGTADFRARTHEEGLRHIPQRRMLPTKAIAKKIGVQFLEAVLKNVGN